eukprot:4263611-Karenia_brevis.AAC.1
MAAFSDQLMEFNKGFQAADGQSRMRAIETIKQGFEKLITAISVGADVAAASPSESEQGND